MLRVRLQSKTMTYETHVTNTNETHAELYESIQRLNEVLSQKKTEKYLMEQNMLRLQSETKEIVRKEKVKKKWLMAISRACCKRLYAVRQVAKIHAAWFQQTSKDTREKHQETNENIKLWQIKLDKMNQEKENMMLMVKKKNQQMKKCNGKCATLTTGIYLLLYRLMQEHGQTNVVTMQVQKIKKRLLTAEADIVLRDFRIQEIYGKMEINSQEVKEAKNEKLSVWYVCCKN